MKMLMLLALFTTDLFAFTLLTNPPVRFPTGKITVNVSSDECTNTGFTKNELLTMVGQAIDKYWNSVSTSAIELTRGSISDVSIKASATSSAILDVVPIGTIIVGCNDQLPAFASGNTGGVGSIRSSGAGVVGAVALNDNQASLASYSETELLALIGHELGHAVGLGHSGDAVALMRYTLSGKFQERLTQDDKDGITYLYPHEAKAAGFAGSCGTIADQNGGDGGWPLFLGTFLIGIFFTQLLRAKFARR